MKTRLVLFLLLALVTFISNANTLPISPQLSQQKRPDNETIYRVSKQLCWGCMAESVEFLFRHNLVRASKWELPLTWDFELEQYARWWAGERKADCKLEHSFPENGFKLGENIFWGGGSAWTPSDAVRVWADEEKYYTYATNSCVPGQMCGHYTQIVWKSTRRIGCARVVIEVAPTHCVVEISKSTGDIRTYNKFCESLSNLVKQKPGVPSQSEDSVDQCASERKKHDAGCYEEPKSEDRKLFRGYESS
ncbi:pathogenesis-related protein 1 [Vigna unguiculata]|uniref:Pathogenesis-related protein 1 n=1 Tax=Vigna unguiculata TaxID=3917 RepID=A0A4D6KVK5_VIGUN|nr:pathogenesis-related protein 1 [Vigna unguiculata]